MPLKNIGRFDGEDAYKYVCDCDGCDNEHKFTINGRLWNDWQVLEVYEEGACIETKYLCPDHHVV